MGFFKRLWTDLMEYAEPGPEDDLPEDNAPQELKDAEQRVPQSKFVQSCRAFYEKRGFLSQKQRHALTYAGTPDRRYRQFVYDYNYDDVHDFDRD